MSKSPKTFADIKERRRSATDFLNLFFDAGRGEEFPWEKGLPYDEEPCDEPSVPWDQLFEAHFKADEPASEPSPSYTALRMGRRRRDREKLLAELDAASAAEPGSDEPAPKKRGRALWRRAVDALHALMKADPESWISEQVEAAQQATSEATGTAAAKPLNRRTGIRLSHEDFFLLSLDVLTEKVALCGSGRSGGVWCGSYWCLCCRNRFGGRHLYALRHILEDRYKGDEQRFRDRVHHLTVLCEIVLPNPKVVVFQDEHYFDFNASEKRRDFVDTRRHIARWQRTTRGEMDDILSAHGLRFELITDNDRKRTTLDRDNLELDALEILELNRDIRQANELDKVKGFPPGMPKGFVSKRISDDDPEGERKRLTYLWQLRKAKPLSKKEISRLARGLQVILRDFPSITHTKFPAYLKFKSAITKIIERERTKLASLYGELPIGAIVGAFQLELIDLDHVIGGQHRNAVKAETIRHLASQPVSGTKPIKQAELPSLPPLTIPELTPEQLKRGESLTPAQRNKERKLRRMKEAKERSRILKLQAKHKGADLLDRARAKVANGEVPNPEEFPGLRYAVLVHFHAVVDLGDVPRADFEQWLRGRSDSGPSSRRFKGKWPLPRQAKLTKLREDKDLGTNLANLAFYPFKPATAFNYTLAENAPQTASFERDTVEFTDEELGLLVWLQQSIGYETLKIRMNPATDEAEGERRRGRKPKPKPSQGSKLPSEEEFMARLEEVLRARGPTNLLKEFRLAGEASADEGVSLGVTDLSPHFEEVEPAGLSPENGDLNRSTTPIPEPLQADDTKRQSREDRSG